jgi:hypothetical protein
LVPKREESTGQWYCAVRSISPAPSAQFVQSDRRQHPVAADKSHA